jgi:hypothetical protein
MRVLSACLIVAAAVLPQPAFAAFENACVFHALGRIPPIPGLKIDNVAVRREADVLRPGEPTERATTVRIAASVANVKGTYAFSCSQRPDGSVSVNLRQID